MTAIIPATDGPSTLHRTLDAIAIADQGPDELIVVDRARKPGPAAARNAGAARASGDLLVFIDADIEVHPDAFVRIRRAFAQDDLLTALFGSYDDDPESESLVSSFRNLLHHHIHQHSSGEATTFWVGLGAIRRMEFLGCGGFDAERYPAASIEDIELGVRLMHRGARIALDPQLQGKHLKHWTARTMTQTDLVRRGGPWVALLLRERRVTASLNLRWRSRISVCVTAWLTWALFSRSGLSAIAATMTILVLEADLYVLLIRRRGVRMAAAGPLLHAVHNLIALASLPLGCAMFLQGRHR